MLINFIVEEGQSIVHLELIFNRFVLASAFLLAWEAFNGVSSLSVIADGSKASRKESNWVSSDEDSSGVSLSVKPFCPLSVTNSRGTECNHFNILELFGCVDVNKTDSCKATSQTDTSNNESSGVNILPESFEHILSNCGPHTVVLSLDFTSFGCMLILSLNYLKATWKAQRRSCQTFLRLAVYRKARTVYYS